MRRAALVDVTLSVWQQLFAAIVTVMVVGLECYIYGFPLVTMDATNGVLTATPKPGEYKAPISQFGRIKTYSARTPRMSCASA